MNKHFHSVAVMFLASALAKHEKDQVPASSLAGFLKHMTDWESQDLIFLTNLLREPVISISTDVETLLKYVPRRRFGQRDEVFEWHTHLGNIIQAIELVKEWGFCAEREKPSKEVEWNAFLIKGLAILGGCKSELIERDYIFQLMRCLGLSRLEALQAIEAQK